MMKTPINIGLFLLLGGCGAAAPPELLSARAAFDQASRGPASEINQAGLRESKAALDVAEHSLSDNGASQDTKDLAYAAECVAHTAEANARATHFGKDRAQTAQQMQVVQRA